MKIKRGLAILLSLAMLIGALPMTVLAESTEREHKGKISLEFMNYITDGDTDDSGKRADAPIVEKKPIPDVSTLTAGKEFMVGIKASDFTNITEAATSGVNILLFGLRYNSNYVEPVDTDVSALKKAVEYRLGNLAEGDAIDLLTGSEATYSYTTASMRTDKTVASTNPDLATAYTILLTDNVNASYKGQRDAYLGIIKFKVKNALPAEGAQIFDIATGEDTAISFGAGGEGGDKFRYHSGEYRMEHIIDFDISGVNIAPTTYDIEYDLNDSGASWIKTPTTGQTAADNKGPITSQSTVKVPKASDVKAPTGKILAGWYIEQNGTAGYQEEKTEGGITTPGDVKLDATTECKADYANTGTKTITLRAIYAEGFTVTFDKNDTTTQPAVWATGAVSAVPKPKTGATWTADDVPVVTREHYVLNNWNTVANGTGTAYPKNDAFVATNYEALSEDTTLYAYWTLDPSVPEADTVTVTFDDCGATTPASPAPVKVFKGDSLGGSMPNDPEKTDYVFEGWYTDPSQLYLAAPDASKKFDKDTAVSADITVYAKWKHVDTDTTQAKVVFDEGKTKGTATVWATVPIAAADWTAKTPLENIFGAGNSMPANPTTTDTTKGFGGWYIDKNNDHEYTDGEPSFTEKTALEKTTTDATEVMNVVARWSTKTTVTVKDPQKTAPADKVKEYTDIPVGSTLKDNGQTLPDPTTDLTPKSDDYVFDGWKADVPDEANPGETKVIPFTEDTPITDGMVIYAGWKVKVKFAVTDDHAYNGAANPATLDMTTATTGDAITPADYTLEYYSDAACTTPLTGDAATDGPTNAGDYGVKITIPAPAHANEPAYELVADPGADPDKADYTVNKKGILFKVTNQEKIVGDTTKPDGLQIEIDTADSTMVAPLPTAGGLTDDPKDPDKYYIEYTLFDDTSKDGIVDPSELGSYSTTVPTVLGKYVAKIVFGDNSNYTAGSYSGTVDVYNNTGDVAPENGTNIKYTIKNATTTLTFKYEDEDHNVQEYAKYQIESDKTITDGMYLINADSTVDTTKVTTLPEFTTRVPDYTFDGWYIDKTGGTADKWDASDEKLEVTTTISNETTVVAKMVLSNNAELEDGDTDFVLSAVNSEDSSIPAYNVKANLTAADYSTNKPFTNDDTSATDVDTYYARVENNLDKLNITMTSVEPGSSVKIEGPKLDGTGTGVLASYIVPEVALMEQKTTAAKLDEADKGSVNTITVTVVPPASVDAGTEDNKKVYTFNVQRKAAPGITLAYGNSPYGEIMSQAGWDDTKKADAKTKFDEKNRYVTDYTPDNVPATAKDMTTGGFGLRAWMDVTDVNAPTAAELEAAKDPDVNMDRNEYAIFVYDDAEAFVDPGFTAKDSLGNDADVTRTITIETMEKKDSFANGVTNSVNVTITGDADTPITDVTNPTDGSYVRIGKYKMTYTANDFDGTPMESVERYVIVLHRLGDTDFSREVGGLDFNPVYLGIADENAYLTTPDETTMKTVDPAARRVYIYRTLDTDFSGAIGGLDFNSIYTGIGIGGLSGLDGLYRELPTGK